jgi:hypothetical protein
VSFKVVWTGPTHRAVGTWGLPDTVFVEMRLRVNELAHQPAGQLVRIRTPFDGMAFGFDLIDPVNRLCVHQFLFQVLYSQDEETLFVAYGMYGRRIG